MSELLADTFSAVFIPGVPPDVAEYKTVGGFRA